MRKMLNKKGFSLVELMIVVVIMGILIAVAIPLYGAITENANNKTCANNIKAIKTNAANYKATYNENVKEAGLKSMFDDNNIPECPYSDDGTANDYFIAIDAQGAAKVACRNIDKHYAGETDNAKKAKIASSLGHDSTVTADNYGS